MQLGTAFCTGILNEIKCSKRDECVLFLVPLKMGEEAKKQLSMMDPPETDDCPYFYKNKQSWGLV